MAEYKKDIKKKDITPAVTDPTKVKVREKSLGRKFADTFLSDDLENVKEYAVRDVIIPAIKNTIVNIVQDGIEMLFFGSTKRSRDNRYGSVGYTSYTGYYNRPKDRPDRRSEPPRKKSYNEIILESRGDAEKVLGDMFDILADYGAVSCADLYELVSISADFTDHNFGWVDLSGSSVKRIREGYLLVLPRPVNIE